MWRQGQGDLVNMERRFARQHILYFAAIGNFIAVSSTLLLTQNFEIFKVLSKQIFLKHSRTAKNNIFPRAPSIKYRRSKGKMGGLNLVTKRLSKFINL